MKNEVDHLLVVLSEECAEVSQRCCKALRFGLDEVQQGQDLNNMERIAVELDDLYAVVDMLRERGVLQPASDIRMSLKKQKVDKYIKYARETGQLLDEPDETPKICPVHASLLSTHCQFCDEIRASAAATLSLLK